MAPQPHIPLRRLEGALERRKAPGFGAAPTRNNAAHGANLIARVAEVVHANVGRTDFAEDPSVVLQLNTAGYVDEAALASVNMRLIAQTSDEVLVAYSPDPELSEFTARAQKYSGPIPEGQKGAAYAGIFGAIEDVQPVPPQGKIGEALRAEGVDGLDAVAALPVGLYDIDLWDAGEELAVVHMERVRSRVESLGGEFLNQYRGAGLFVARVRCSGQVLESLLSERVVASIDTPPVADFPENWDTELTTDDLPEMAPLADDVITIGVIDSGLSSAHPMLAPAVVGEFGVPAHLGTDDEQRHGTSVAGIATYGSIADQINAGYLQPQFRIASAKVVNGHGHFADEIPVPAIIEEAIRRLHAEFGCRVINISLADIKRTVGGRPSNWATVLDNLARELDLVILVSAGNTKTASTHIANGGIAAYPGYMLETDNRLYEPASAVSAMVVSSLAHGNGLTPQDAEFPDIVALTDVHDPSPFSRCGPGYRESVKPDLAEYGGTAVWQGFAGVLTATRDSCGVLTLDANYTQNLLTFRHGTSFAAPAASYKAASIRQTLPDASANLVRALLALSAEHPGQLLARTAGTGRRDYLRFAGYGVADIDRAIRSDDVRPVLYAEDTLGLDRFAVYEVPIPPNFQTEKGIRHIRVALAFDPPTRNSRKEYVGVSMNFRLVRGVSEQEVFDRYRRWEQVDRDEIGDPYTFEKSSADCPMEPIPSSREGGTLQVATFTAKKNIESYGDKYFLVVRCEGKWASGIVDDQNFSVAVQMWHEAQIEIYQHLAVPVTA